MTTASSPGDPDLYERLMRERYGDVSALSRELTNHVPPPTDGPVLPDVPPPPDVPTRTPPGAGRYAEDHARVLRWVTRSHPEWVPELCVLGAGGVAHVITSRGPTVGYALCGKKGAAYTASDTIPLCRVCSA